MLLKGEDVAYLGVLLGLNQFFIILSSVIETNTIILLAGAALVVGIVIVEFGGKSGAVFYIASCILGFVLTFNKIEFATYILFFGLYSIVKHLLESKLYKTILIYAAKLIFFNLSLAAMYFTVKLFMPLQLAWWMIAAAQLLFIIYDYAFAVFITAYITHIKTKIRRG
ncbi:MAG TPA: hypothetical protein DC038_01865 [Clostridiales bacterium]|nr:hypothetical protein [Clostridiales bacterium]